MAGIDLLSNWAGSSNEAKPSIQSVNNGYYFDHGSVHGTGLPNLVNYENGEAPLFGIRSPRTLISKPVSAQNGGQSLGPQDNATYNRIAVQTLRWLPTLPTIASANARHDTPQTTQTLSQYGFLKPPALPMMSRMMSRSKSTLSTITSSPKSFLDLGDEVLQGLIHIWGEPEIGHSSLDTAELWLHILNQGFPQEEGYYRKTFQETLSNDDDDRSGILIEVWKTEGYWNPGTNTWVTLKNVPVFVLLCQFVSYAVSEFPPIRLKHDTTIEIKTPLQCRLQNRCAQLLEDTESANGFGAGITCGSAAMFFKWKLEDPDKFICCVSGFVDLGGGNVPGAAKVVEQVVARVKDRYKKGKISLSVR